MLQVFQTLLQLPRFHGVPLNDTLLQWCSSTSIGQHHFYHQTLDIVGICSQYQHRSKECRHFHFWLVSLTNFLCFTIQNLWNPTSAHCPKFWVTSWCCFVFFRDTVPSPRSAACLSLISRADGRRRASPSHHSNTCTEEEQKRNNSNTILRSWVTKNELDISSFFNSICMIYCLGGVWGPSHGMWEVGQSFLSTFLQQASSSLCLLSIPSYTPFLSILLALHSSQLIDVVQLTFLTITSLLRVFLINENERNASRQNNYLPLLIVHPFENIWRVAKI